MGLVRAVFQACQATVTNDIANAKIAANTKIHQLILVL